MFDCKLDELAKLRMSSISWISCICNFDELDRLGMSASWIN